MPIPTPDRSGRKAALRGLRLALPLLIAGCSPLAVFEAVVPKDGGVREVVADAPYGGDARQRIDLYAPRARAGDAASARPIILFFYGGSWSSGDRAGYGFVARALAARGFLVAVPDYRLVPAVRFPAFVEDGAAALGWVRANAARYGGDPGRIVIAGHSAGAYIAAMLALDPRWLAPADRAAVRGWIGLAGPYDFLPFDVAAARAAFAGAPDPAATQPVTFASGDDPPAFLATGDRDDTVRPRNSDALAARLAAAGVAVERRRYAGIGHIGILTAIAQPLRGRAPVLADMTAFARRVTR